MALVNINNAHSAGGLNRATIESMAYTPKEIQATAKPSATSDSSHGYAIGNVWLVLGGANIGVYYCLDNTDNAAVWGKITVTV
jgi:hypothetical protein